MARFGQAWCRKAGAVRLVPTRCRTMRRGRSGKVGLGAVRPVSARQAWGGEARRVQDWRVMARRGKAGAAFYGMVR